VSAKGGAADWLRATPAEVMPNRSIRPEKVAVSLAPSRTRMFLVSSEAGRMRPDGVSLGHA